MSNTTLTQYTQELLPKLRRAEELKEYIKDFKANDDRAMELIENIKEAQAELKDYLTRSEEAGEWIEELNDILNDVKEGAKAAVKDTEYKPAVYKTFLSARVKQKEQEVIEKGEVFEQLVKEIQ